jgi:hypothetical protein
VCESAEILEFLIGINILQEKEMDLPSILTKALEVDDVSIFRFLIEKGVDPRIIVRHDRSDRGRRRQDGTSQFINRKSNNSVRKSPIHPFSKLMKV